MGNRAVIATRSKNTGMYIHWNGGRDSIEAFLEYAKLKGWESPEKEYGTWLKLSKVVNNFAGGCSGEIDKYKNLDTDNYDNGVYIIQNWKIVDRLFLRGSEQREYPLQEMVVCINDAQPEGFRILNDDIEWHFNKLQVNKIISFRKYVRKNK